MKNTIKIITAALALTFAAQTAPAFAAEALAYLYGGTTAVYLSRAEKTGDSLTAVAPDYFETADSGAVIYTKTPDPLLIAAMRERGLRVTPFLSNHWNRAQARATLARRGEAAAFLVSALDRYDLDGLNIDLQNITEHDRESFSDFIRILHGMMPQGKTLTVCVAANPRGWTTGWQGGYDYAELAKHCDYVFMMTYDESYEGSEPGPVASYKFIEDSIKYGLRYVPPEKLMMGIPFYGRYWSDAPGGRRGYAFTVADIDWLVETTGAAAWYDGENECARASIVIPAGSNYKTWGGYTIPPGAYDVWYENARSLERKLSLVRAHGIGGVGVWALGQEPPYVWDNFSAWLSGCPFDDISGHWAQSYIVSLASEGILKGVGGRRYNPEGAMTRAEAAALLCRISGLVPQPGANAFGDTRGHWAAEYIAAAKDAELVEGESPGIYTPDRKVTREEFAVMCERYTNIADTLNLTEPLYGDVSKDANPWSSDAIVKLSVNGVFSGYPDGRFRPRGNVTRAEAAKTLSLLRELPTRFVKGRVIPMPTEFMGPR